jgi:hypothetical protein
MALSYELLVEGAGAVPHAVAIGRHPFAIGRGPTNDLVAPDGMVSWEHARFWADGEKLWCSDQSTNGTFVNEERIRGTVQLAVNDVVRLGDRLRLKVQLHGTAGAAEAPVRTFALEAVSTGLRHPFRNSRLVLGSAEDADLRIASAAPYAAEFAMHGPDELVAMIGSEERSLQLGDRVVVAGMEFVVVEVDGERAPTIQPTRDRFPYRLVATLDGPTGPHAELMDVSRGNAVRVDAETRAILLYLLGKKVDDDRKSTIPRDEVGWAADDDVIVGVWGRSGLQDGANRLKVLVHRLRAEIDRAGMDPWCLERRRRFIRIRLREFVQL